MGSIRVLVVDDSVTVRRRIMEALSFDRDLEVVGEAGDGKTAVEMCGSLRPDAVTLDMVLPVMSGLAATEHIMAYFPTPILIVSSSTNRGEVFKTYDALAAGAVDVIEKPSGQEVDGVWERTLIEAVKMVSRIKVITHPRGRLSRCPPPSARPRELRTRLVAIGASTGGPGALVRILGGLDASFPFPILLVVHIGPAFASAFADWLDGQSPLRVAFAKDGEEVFQPGGGRVVLAPPDRHLAVQDGRLRLTEEGERHSCRPSIDVLFESVARGGGPGAVGCLLTGMGRDGASGLLEVKKAGGVTIAQDEATSVVYGMPHEAVLLGAADHVLALDDVAPFLTKLAFAGRSP